MDGLVTVGGGDMMAFRYWTVFMGVVTLLLAGSYLPLLRYSECSKTLWTFSGDDFEGFDNVSGIQTNTYIVPNYVHFLRVGPKMKEIPFMDFICILAAFKNQQPDKIFFHTDFENFSGKYWEKLSALPGFLDKVTFVSTKIPLEIHGQPFSRPDHHLFHAGDVLRIRLLKKYGGIFLDNDSYLVRNMDVYRKFEMALSWDEGQYLGTQILVAHKDARFLKLWEETYRDNYRPYLWYYNAGERPTTVVLYNRPEVIHRVKLLFGTHDLRVQLYQKLWPEWRRQYTIHLLSRHTRWVKGPFFINETTYVLPDEFTEENIVHYPTTILDMVQDVYDIS